MVQAGGGDSAPWVGPIPATALPPIRAVGADERSVTLLRTLSRKGPPNERASRRLPSKTAVTSRPGQVASGAARVKHPYSPGDARQRLEALQQLRHECIITYDTWMKDAKVEFVFDGTVIENAIESGFIRSTIQVHRVWKGAVTRQFMVYGVGEIDGIPALDEHGRRYVVAASRLAVGRPPRLGIELLADDAVLLRPCSAFQFRGSVPSFDVSRYLGPGRPPK